MQWVSIAQLQANADPHYRLKVQKQHMQECIAQARLEQTERHHQQRQIAERERLEAGMAAAEMQGRAMIEREHISGQNAIALAHHNHALAQSAKSSSLIDEMMMSIMRQDEEWNKTVADTMRGLILSEADTIKQERLRKLDHTHTLEKMQLESNLRMVEMVLTYELQNLRVSYDKTCDIIFRLIERALGLGPHQVQVDAVRDWVREAMEQNG
jgi:hypothetical protein